MSKELHEEQFPVFISPVCRFQSRANRGDDDDELASQRRSVRSCCWLLKLLTASLCALRLTFEQQEPARSLRSFGRSWGKDKNQRRRALTARALKLWRELPEEIRAAGSAASFRSLLLLWSFFKGLTDFMGRYEYQYCMYWSVMSVLELQPVSLADPIVSDCVFSHHNTLGLAGPVKTCNNSLEATPLLIVILIIYC